jgi:hypothetical protein
MVNLIAFGTLHGVEAAVQLIPYAGPVLAFILHLVTG